MTPTIRTPLLALATALVAACASSGSPPWSNEGDLLVGNSVINVAPSPGSPLVVRINYSAVASSMDSYQVTFEFPGANNGTYRTLEADGTTPLTIPSGAVLEIADPQGGPVTVTIDGTPIHIAESTTTSPAPRATVSAFYDDLQQGIHSYIVVIRLHGKGRSFVVQTS